MINWSDLEPKAPPPDTLTGPELILAGKGCRVVVKSISDEDRRDTELGTRVHRLVGILLDAGCAGFSATPVEGYGEIRGAAPTYYVRGTTTAEVIGTIGRAIIKARSELRDQVRDLGVYALMEW